MTRTDDKLALAQAGDRDAIRAVLVEVYPGTHRIAHALAGEESRASTVLNNVFRNAMRVLSQWNSWADPETWFFHQTVQAARRECQGRPASDEDLLLTALPIEQRTAPFAAFVRGIRRLPQQQIEAFILHYGQRLNERLIGVAMDCSTQAAQTHLRAAETAMRPLAGEDWEALTAMLFTACSRLSPSPQDTERMTQRYLGAWAGGRLRWHIGKFVLILLLAVALLLIWPLRGKIYDTMAPASQPSATR